MSIPMAHTHSESQNKLLMSQNRTMAIPGIPSLIFLFSILEVSCIVFNSECCCFSVLLLNLWLLLLLQALVSFDFAYYPTSRLVVSFPGYIIILLNNDFSPNPQKGCSLLCMLAYLATEERSSIRNPPANNNNCLIFSCL